MRTKVILIRHGETKANVQRRYIGITESLLTSTGRIQGKKLKQRMAAEKVHKVFASPSKRAFNFAEIVFNGSGIETSVDLREMNFGIFEGLTYSQIVKKYPEIYSSWLKHPLDSSIPRAENFGVFKARVLGALNKIISRNNGKTIAIVTHSGPIRLILSGILKIKNIWEVMPHLASVSIIEFNKSEPKVSVYNDISHYQ